MAQITIYKISWSQIRFGTVTKITDKIRSKAKNFARTDNLLLPSELLQFLSILSLRMAIISITEIYFVFAQHIAFLPFSSNCKICHISTRNNKFFKSDLKTLFLFPTVSFGRQNNVPDCGVIFEIKVHLI